VTALAAERDVVIVACAISAGVHAALAPEHFDESTAMGIGFLGSAFALAILVVALTRHATPVALALAGAVLVGLLAGWILAIGVGLPLLHPETEAVDVLALATKAVEAAGLAAALRLLMRRKESAGLALPPKGALT
jgi:hypothetical protein